MAIHRVGPAPDTTPHRQNLGRVLVTIDDLDALMQLVRQNLGEGLELGIQFEGGYFTEAEDLRRLSDEESKSLKIHTADIEIHLAHSQAVVIGNEQQAQDIYRLWARPRENHSGVALGTFLKTLGGLIILAGAIAVLLGYFQVDGIDDRLLILPACLFGGMLIYLGEQQHKRIPEARIKPISLHEHRQILANNQIPRWQTIVAIVAVAVAIIAIVAPIVFR